MSAPIRIALGLGSNLGDRRASLWAAVEALAPLGTELRLASLYQTAPIGPPQPDYLNSAMSIVTAVEPQAILEAALAIEAARGRVRRVRWGPRTLDVDLLVALDDRGRSIVIDAPALRLPHPELPHRAFALAPLLEVMPELSASHGPLLAALGGAPEVVGSPDGDPQRGYKGWTAGAPVP